MGVLTGVGCDEQFSSLNSIVCWKHKRTAGRILHSPFNERGCEDGASQEQFNCTAAFARFPADDTWGLFRASF